MKALDTRALKVSKPLLLLLALTLGLIAFVYFRGETQDAAPPVDATTPSTPSTPRAAAPQSPASAPESPEPETVANAASAPVDLFPSQNWQPPPPPPPPPPPTQPTLASDQLLGPLGLADADSGTSSSDQSDEDKKKDKSGDDEGVNAALRLINTTPINLDQPIEEPVTSGSDIDIGLQPLLDRN